MKLEAKILDERLRQFPPKYATSGAAAIDLRACRLIGDDGNPRPITATGFTIKPGEVKKIGTGFSVHIGSLNHNGAPYSADRENGLGVAAMILPRSGLGADDGIVVGNLVGLIDSDYQGELVVALWNRGKKPHSFAPLARIAQAVFALVLTPAFQFVDDEFSQGTARGAGGFGSTGKGV